MNKPRSGQLRIIGGEWRSRKLPVLDLPDLRPTGDRVRETLFNWLQPYIEGSNCLDLFAGSGALGLEALSRGARRVHFIDQSAAAIRQLQQNLHTLGCERAELRCSAASDWLQSAPPQRFDIVFLDPPFSSDQYDGLMAQLQASGRLAEQALVYLEFDRNRPMPKVPAAWQLLRQKQAGKVSFCLLQADAG